MDLSYICIMLLPILPSMDLQTATHGFPPRIAVGQRTHFRIKEVYQSACVNGTHWSYHVYHYHQPGVISYRLEQVSQESFTNALNQHSIYSTVSPIASDYWIQESRGENENGKTHYYL